jgi:hypothetical protein
MFPDASRSLHHPWLLLTPHPNQSFSFSLSIRRYSLLKRVKWKVKKAGELLPAYHVSLDGWRWPGLNELNQPRDLLARPDNAAIWWQNIKHSYMPVSVARGPLHHINTIFSFILELYIT